MYLRYAERHGWRVEVLLSPPLRSWGIDSVTFVVKGEDAWQRMSTRPAPTACNVSP